MIKTFDGEYAYLSNFYSSPIIYEGIQYPTVEHAFQAAKSLDMVKRQEIANATTPGIAKRLGRRVTLRPDWEEVKDDVMYQLLILKFQNPIAKARLIETGCEYLVEGNTWHDNHFGNCTCNRCQHICGQNVLGTSLMRVRSELQQELK